MHTPSLKKEIAVTELPVVLLKDALMYPSLTAPFAIGEQRSMRALKEAARSGQKVVVLAVKNNVQKPNQDDLYRVGTLASVIEQMGQPDGSTRVLFEGVERVIISTLEERDGVIFATCKESPDELPQKSERVEALMVSVVNAFKDAVNAGAPVPFDALMVVLNITDPLELAYTVAVNLGGTAPEKQAVLEAQTVEEKLQAVLTSVLRQRKVLTVAREIEQKSGRELGKMEKEMMLREELKQIEKELGQAGGVSEVETLRKRIADAHMPEDIHEIAEKELARMAGLPSFSPEISYIRTYLDWLITIPWQAAASAEIDIKKAKKILDDDHYGLDQVKERVLEFLSVQKLTGKLKGPLLCFAGAPGTGKTSIGKSIARALNRPFVRISLGGVRDEAEIRGFRRTYVGALPGRIIQGLVTAKAKNPVFMLDEIDKLGSDGMRGDPSAALLEALDPEQNHAFSDHYLEAPVDLSDVLFVTTANLLENIPPALRDRMEVIDFPGYTEDEKFHIANDYLLPKQITNHGLSEKKVRFDAEALLNIVRLYTREAGVRGLDREIASVLRKVARAFAEKSAKQVTVGASTLAKYLGPVRFHSTESEKHDEVGIVTGLAWTEVGGEILPIEAVTMPGVGKLTLTGHLGQVMQESAQAAYSYARTVASELGIAPEFYKNLDVHVHVPQGAIPKDGPSAGVAMAVVLCSALTGRKIRHEVAMTGEVTLRGRVLEIGGVKEKILAAHRAGVKTVILPKDNEKDLVEVPASVRKSLRFVFAQNMEEVLKKALQP